MSWIDAIVEGGLARCQSLGLLERGPRQSWGPCPACGATQRSESTPTDRRLALQSGGHAAGRGWWCPRCDARGDALDLVAWRVCGARYRDLATEQRRDVRAWVVDRVGEIRPMPEREPEPEPAPEYPPRDEVGDLWAQAWDMTGEAPDDAAPMVEYATRRAGCDLPTVADTGLCRVLPPRAMRPELEWWPYGDTWRLVWGLYDAGGDLRSILARTTDPDEAARRGKERPPMGYSRSRLVVADARARAMMRGEAAPEVCYVVEGPTSAMRLSACLALAGDDGAVIGVFSGSPPALGHIRWPRSTAVAIGTDDDEAGTAYYRQVRTALPPFISAHRIPWARETQLGGECGE